MNSIIFRRALVIFITFVGLCHFQKPILTSAGNPSKDFALVDLRYEITNTKLIVHWGWINHADPSGWSFYVWILSQKCKTNELYKTVPMKDASPMSLEFDRLPFMNHDTFIRLDPMYQGNIENGYGKDIKIETPQTRLITHEESFGFSEHHILVNLKWDSLSCEGLEVISIEVDGRDTRRLEQTNPYGTAVELGVNVSPKIKKYKITVCTKETKKRACTEPLTVNREDSSSVTATDTTATLSWNPVSPNGAGDAKYDIFLNGTHHGQICCRMHTKCAYEFKNLTPLSTFYYSMYNMNSRRWTAGSSFSTTGSTEVYEFPIIELNGRWLMSYSSPYSVPFEGNLNFEVLCYNHCDEPWNGCFVSLEKMVLIPGPGRKALVEMPNPKSFLYCTSQIFNPDTGRKGRIQMAYTHWKPIINHSNYTIETQVRATNEK